MTIPTEPTAEVQQDQEIIPDPNWVEPVETAPHFDPTLPAGQPHGSEVVQIDEKTREEFPTGEIVVHEVDENGNVIGWHKEAKPNG